MKSKFLNILNNPFEYFFRLVFLLYRSVSYPVYLILLKQYGKKSFIHPLASIRNHKNISIGDNVIINRNVNFWVASLRMGDNIQINPNTCIYGNVMIGNNVMIAPNCMIVSGNHGIDNSNEPMIVQKCTSKGPIIVEDDVWIAANSVILDGVKISKGAVIGAGSVVTKNVPPMAIVCGNPARVLRYRTHTNIGFDK